MEYTHFSLESDGAARKQLDADIQKKLKVPARRSSGSESAGWTQDMAALQGTLFDGFGARFAAPFCRKHQSCVHCQGLLKHTVFQQRLNGPFQPNCWEDHCEIFRISFLLILTQTTKPSCENWSLHRSTLHSLLLESTGTRFKPLQFMLIQSYSQAWNIPADYKKQKTKHWGKIKHLTLKLIYCHSTVLELATQKATRTL